MEIYGITVGGSGFDKEYNFNNYALTLVVKDDEAEKTVRANLPSQRKRMGFKSNLS
ncbi:MAG: hypothetical protein WA125_09965 [Desulfosporosinus sp.]